MKSEPYLSLIERCECAERSDQAQILADAFALLKGPPQTRRGSIVQHHPQLFAFEKMVRAEAFESAAIFLLPEGAIWRRYSDFGASVYAASPYNAKAQVRHDGFTPVFALGLVSAALRMAVAPILKAEAAEARTRDSGSRSQSEDARSAAEAEGRQSGGEAASPKGSDHA